MRQRFFATCGRGIEPILAQELIGIGVKAVRPGRGGVEFEGDLELLYRANLSLRTAIRVLRPVLQATVRSPDELYDAVRSVDWSRYLTPDHTIAVDCNVRDSALTHSKYAALKTKDAICDQFVDRFGRRPNVDVIDPMIPLNLHIYRNEAILSLDSSGPSLHKRGYRPVLTKAPLNEALAAALILSTGWRGNCPFIDPMCGSGTLPIEAAWIALNRPPGLTRRRFGFQGWLDHDIQLWTRIRDEARTAMHKHPPTLFAGSDIRPDVVEQAQRNAKAAGVGHVIQFSVMDIKDFCPPPGPSGVLFCNPPYGARLGKAKEDLPELYRRLGDALRRCSGWTAWLFVGNSTLLRHLRLQPTSETPFFNGKIHCKLIRFDIR
ncbi:MAG: RNA methyltransferase [Gemmatales bacterium]|nr:MAG: RNA methyltransferase [Gemmatales bacterium]